MNSDFKDLLNILNARPSKLWESENQADDRAATVQAAREALDDMRAGDAGVPASEAIAELRRKHKLPEPS